MRLSDFPLNPKNHFVAMEYYGLILNRTFLILLAEKHMIGMVANGIVSAQSSPDPLTAIVTGKLSIHGELDDPHSYLNNKHLKQASNVDLLGDDFLKLNRANFRAGFDEVSEVSYDPRKKWGMGHYPHDGKVYVRMNGKKREFIILGSQSGQEIAGWIEEQA
jgi:hypothetical protein